MTTLSSVPPHPTHLLGQQAERLAVRNLSERGFRILGTNWSCSRGEIDIIAARGTTVHFIEVKGQAAERNGFAAHHRADTGKMRRVARAARAWLYAHGREPDCEWQMDIMELTVGHDTAHIRHFLGVGG
jgi:putative endonuclease